MNIITAYPFWYIIFCLLIGFLYTYFLYKKDKQFNDLQKNKLYLMGGLRFIFSTLLAFFLLSPMIKIINKVIVFSGIVPNISILQPLL